MDNKTRAYWIATISVACLMTISGAMAITHALPMRKALAHLGYPPYFLNILGVGKLIGLPVLVTPGLPKLKEWAYAGFSITILSACYRVHLHLIFGESRREQAASMPLRRLGPQR